MKRAVITGATGAIGTALIKELIQEDIEVLVICRENSNRLSNIPNHPLVTKAFCSLERLQSFSHPTKKRYDVFYHFAWDGTFGDARNDMFLQNLNVKYALDAVNLAHRLGCHTFIGAGSQAEYGRCHEKLNSLTPVNPENGYGIAKLTAGLMTRELAHQLGMRHIWVRVLSIYGPNDGKNSMVMSTVRKLKNGETPQMTKGEQIWDYLFSEDAAAAFRLVGLYGKDGSVYTLGSGDGRPLSDYVNIIRDCVDPDAQIALGAVPYGEKQVMYLCADISEIVLDTGWSPKTDFREGIRKIIDTMDT